MANHKPNMTVYRIMQGLSGIVAKVVFRRKFLRNEINDKKGPMVIIGNHEAALDFTTIVGATKEPITFVVSDSFYNTLPFRKAMKMIGVIPKQQFQTTIKEISLMRSAIKHDDILMFFPAGLMSDDGLSTPIPSSTYAFLQWLGADVYVARVSGTYFCTPKWSSKIRPGRTYTDIYKLIDKDELPLMTEQQIKEKVKEALTFDTYKEQEELKIKYLGASNVKGLENVLYICPNCKQEFTIRAKKKHTLYCTECGFAHKSDKYGFLHNVGSVGEEIRYVSDWSRMIHDQVKEDMESGKLTKLYSKATIQTIDYKKKKYVTVGRAHVTLTPEKFIISGPINCKYQHLEIPISHFASLPFKPGCRIEVQHGKTTYRCLLDDCKLATKFVDMVRIYYEIENSKQ
ncbi:MAG: 1-acyl-sn-glycerol-3-phosphate acyltransferase [Clostridia bacterium]|nr:1-acyl-sn-glycerol-3-phosphate acyltransferase [Clostridia bacterium]